jgi:hypothetical protein
MKVLDIFGRPTSKSLSKYLISWNGPSLSKVQFATKQFLYPYWKFNTVTEEFKIPSCLLSCDLLNWTKMISIEVDGGAHDKYNPFFHNGNRSEFLASIKRDDKKDKWLEKSGFKVARIPEKEVKLLSPKYFLEKFDIEL